jgi:hypothetical protein
LGPGLPGLGQIPEEVALFSIILFLKVMERTKELIKKDKEEFFFLQRLRFWAVSLARAGPYGYRSASGERFIAF